MNKKICDNSNKLSPVKIDVIKKDEDRTLREQLTHDYSRHVLGELLLCKIRTQLSQSLEKNRTVSKQTHIRSSVALICLSIRRRQLSLQRARRLGSNTQIVP